MGFAQRWGFGGLDVVNLFGWRTHDPRQLRMADDPIGPRNDVVLRKVVRGAGQVVVAWGNAGRWMGRDAQVLTMLGATWCLGQTASGSPRHPLYVRSDTELLAYEPPLR
jgi:hypothetical protein